jgi:hypothetical protein
MNVAQEKIEVCKYYLHIGCSRAAQLKLRGFILVGEVARASLGIFGLFFVHFLENLVLHFSA